MEGTTQQQERRTKSPQLFSTVRSQSLPSCGYIRPGRSNEDIAVTARPVVNEWRRISCTLARGVPFAFLPERFVVPTRSLRVGHSFFFFVHETQKCKVPCPERYYRNATAAGSQDDCAYCVSGGYCPSGSTEPLDCPRGYYCVHGKPPSMYVGEKNHLSVGCTSFVSTHHQYSAFGVSLKEHFGTAVSVFGAEPSRALPPSCYKKKKREEITSLLFPSFRGNQACRSRNPVRWAPTATTRAFEKSPTARAATRGATATSAA